MSRATTLALTVDAVITDPERGVLLVRRRHPPFQGAWALPGGFVEPQESCPQACQREVREETGLEVDIVALLGVYSCPGRDPRGPTVSVAYLCRPRAGSLQHGDDAAEAAWFAQLDKVVLAFDHATILTDACLLPFPAPTG
jgi:8-oxo-dGTP diphosphatase